jgi:hypothetical protein
MYRVLNENKKCLPGTTEWFFVIIHLESKQLEKHIVYLQ